mgnify:FL=1
MITYTYSISQMHTQTHTLPQTITLQLISRDAPDAPKSAVVSICGQTRTLTTSGGAYALSGRVWRARNVRVKAHTKGGAARGGGWMLAREDVSWTELRVGDLIKIVTGQGDALC